MTDEEENEGLRFLLQESIWRPEAVSGEPFTVLTRWAVRRVHANFDKKGSSIHLIGYAGYEGRVCSPLQHFDKTTMRGVSRSGRIYELAGKPGYDPDAEYVWQRWLQRNGNPQWNDVTDEYVAS